MKDFLKQFRTSGTPCEMFNVKEMPTVVATMKNCLWSGWLRTVDDRTELLDSTPDKVWWIETFILTEAGEIYCGLKKPQEQKKGLF